MVVSPFYQFSYRELLVKLGDKGRQHALYDMNDKFYSRSPPNYQILLGPITCSHQRAVVRPLAFSYPCSPILLVASLSTPPPALRALPSNNNRRRNDGHGRGMGLGHGSGAKPNHNRARSLTPSVGP